MTLTFNPVVYNNLLTEVTPKVIETEREYEQMLAIAESLTFQTNRSLEQTAIYKLLVTLIEAYESEQYPMQAAVPHIVLHHLMDASETKVEDLIGVLGNEDTVAQIMAGQQSISIVQAHILGKKFKVDPELFRTHLRPGQRIET